MKKMNFFKILMSTLFTFVLVSSVLGQAIIPDNTVTTFTDGTSYLEIIQTGLGNGSLSDGPNANENAHVNYVTANGTYGLVEIDGAGTTPITYFVPDPATAIVHYMPLGVTPDQAINPNSYDAATAAYTFANVLNSVWNWNLDNDIVTGGYQAPTTAAFVDPSDVPASFTTAGTYYTTSNFLQRYLNVGSTIETYRVLVAEESVNAAGTAGLCSGSDAYVDFSVVAAPTGVEDGTSAVDVLDCASNLEDAVVSTDLVIALTGTPPFGIGFWYNEQVIAATTTDNYTFTYLLTGATDGSTSTDQAGLFEGTLTGAGTNWLYTIEFQVDADGSDATFPNDLALNGGVNTTNHQFGVAYVNSLYSRKSDRRASTIGAPSVVGEVEDHVLYTASGDLNIQLYPTPSTGNIFTIPN